MKLTNKKDSLIVVIIIIIALSGFLIWSFFLGDQGNCKKAVFYIDNEPVWEVVLDGREVSYYVGGSQNMKVQTYSDGTVAIIHSGCKDQICVKTGKIRRIGQTSVCMPNKSYLIIEACND